MHLKTHRRKKDGKDHRWFSVVENRRLRAGKPSLPVQPPPRIKVHAEDQPAEKLRL